MSLNTAGENEDLTLADRVDLACDGFDRRWRDDDEPRLEQYLANVPEPEQAEFLQELLAVELEYRRARGEQPRTDEYVVRFPEHAVTIDLAFGAGIKSSSDKRLEASGQLVPRETTLGDYELLEKLGAGGMGIVYRARQAAADRIVALKVIRPDFLAAFAEEDRSRLIERFQNEAQAAARLNHEGIVTVYEVGQADGRHFFSMRYVQGPSLRDVLGDGPLENRAAALRLAEVARAVHAAHTAGILHRDLKPQNLLIDHASGRALVADFGLAKVLEAPQDLTQTGEMMGTPQYMAPEQVQDASRACPASDVYSLGATLYHALTGRPPFQAASVMETLRQVLEDDPAPPQQLNRSVDIDLETICLRCLEKEPARRFQTAGELADELKRYSDGLPIRSRRIGPAGRLRRWARRKPAVAALSAVAIVAVFVALAGTTAGYVRAAAARQLSESGFREARNTLNQFVTRIRDEDQLNQPQLRPLKEDLLRQALEYYQGFLKKRADDPTVRDDVAETYFRVGLLNEEIVSDAAALVSFERALDVLALQDTDDRSGGSHREACSNAQNAMGRVLFKLGRTEESRRAFLQAVERRQQLVSDAHTAGKPTVELERHLLNSLMNLGILEQKAGRFGQSLQYYRCSANAENLLAVDPDDRKLRRDVAKGAYNQGLLAARSGDLVEAQSQLSVAAETFCELVAGPTIDDDDRYHLALSQRALGELTPQYEPAFKCYEQALAEIRSLAKKNPDIDKYCEELGETLLGLGQLAADAQQYELATVRLTEAESVFRDLLQINPSATRIAERLRETQQVLALVGEQ